jgi:hypothetical protein
MRAKNLRTNIYGYWLPVYKDSDDKTIKTLVLREYRACLARFKLQGYIPIVLSKHWYEKQPDFNAFKEIPETQKTYGWKAVIATKEK